LNYSPDEDEGALSEFMRSIFDDANRLVSSKESIFQKQGFFPSQRTYILKVDQICEYIASEAVFSSGYHAVGKSQGEEAH